MTAILAVRDGRRVLFGSDRAMDGEWLRGQCGPKTLSIGPWRVAAAGAIGGHWESLSDRDPPPTVSALLMLLGPGPDAEVLIGRGSKVWSAWYQAEEKRWAASEVKGPSAIGSGACAALGAFLAGQGTVKQRVQRALRIAAKITPGVAGPFDLVWT